MHLVGLLCSSCTVGGHAKGYVSFVHKWKHNVFHSIIKHNHYADGVDYNGIEVFTPSTCAVHLVAHVTCLDT